MSTVEEAVFNEKEIPAHIQEILTLGLTDLFVPVRFISGADGKGRLRAVFLTNGLYPLRKLKRLPKGAGLDILRSLISGIEQAEKRFILAEEYIVHPALLYIDIRENGTYAKLLWRPKPVDGAAGTCAETDAERYGILSIVYALRVLTDNSGKKELEEAERLIKSGANGKTLSRRLSEIEKSGAGDRGKIKPTGAQRLSVPFPIYTS